MSADKKRELISELEELILAKGVELVDAEEETEPLLEETLKQLAEGEIQDQVPKPAVAGELLVPG